MNHTAWIVVANAARARLLEHTPGRRGYTTLADLVHPQSRQKGVELAAEHGGDRPGHVEGQGHGLGSASYRPRTDPREREQERFAREVAAAINEGVAAGRCTAVGLVASAAFLGQLKAQLSTQAHKLLQHTLASDYTGLSDEELAQRLAEWRH